MYGVAQSQTQLKRLSSSRPLLIGLPWWLRGQKNPPAMQETWVLALGREDPLEEEDGSWPRDLAGPP